MILSDNHLHSFFSSDSSTKLEDIANTAIATGLTSICMTDHHDIDFPVDETNPMDFQLDAPSYIEAVHNIANTYKGRLEISTGVELGLMKAVAAKAKAYTSTYDFDFVIGSSHLVNGIDPYNPEYFYDKTEAKGYRLYFEAILDNVTCIKDYDVYGHLDYVVRYGPSKSGNYNFKAYYDIFEAILMQIISDGKGIEINTGGLYKGLTFPHPKIEILKLYKELGGEIITVGSDAHSPNYIGYGFDVAESLLQKCGFRYYCTFKNRKPIFHNL